MRLPSIAIAILLTGCTSAIQDNLAMNDVLTVGDSFTSSFLVPTEDGAILFDAGITASGKPLADALAALGLSTDDVTDVFLSHGHGDHVAGLPAFAGARIRAFAAEQAVLDEEQTSVSIDAPVADGDLVRIGGRTVETFHVPGHTPGSGVYLVDGVLLMGDSAVATPGGRLEQPPERYSADVAQLDRSLFALRDRLRPRASDVDWIAYSHSGPTEGLGALEAYTGRDDFMESQE